MVETFRVCYYKISKTLRVGAILIYVVDVGLFNTIDRQIVLAQQTRTMIVRLRFGHWRHLGEFTGDFIVFIAILLTKSVWFARVINERMVSG